MEHFQFLCDTKVSNITNEEIVKMLPPWKTKILNVKRISEDQEKIQLTFIIAATTIEAVKRWVQAYQELTFCTYYIRNTPQCRGEKVIFSQVLICHHNCKKKIKEDEVKKKLHKRRRDTNCPSFIRIKLYVPKKRNRKDTPLKLQDEDMPCEIVLVPTHNHEIKNAEALSWRRVSDEVKQRINNLFDRGHNPGSSRELLKLDIYINYDNYETLLADRKFYPDYQFCSYLYNKYKKDNEKIDDVNDIQDINVLTKIIEDYREITNDDSIRFTIDSTGYVITICTPLFQRVHEHAKYCSDVVVLDSIKCDTKNDKIKLYMLYTASECGNLPLGAIITSFESTEKLTQGFEILKEMLQNRIFLGNVSGPKVFLSNDNVIDREAIKTSWTESLNLLSPYHVLQNVFKWLIKPNNAIIKCDQLTYFQSFKSVLLAETEEESEENYHKLLFTSDKYMMFINHLISLWDRRRLWAFSYRSSLLNKISRNLLKEQVFDRIKDMNISQLLNFLLVKLQTYYEGKILNCLLSETFVDFKHILTPPENIVDRIQKLGENLFLVPSETQDDLFYLVNLEASSCSCSEDSTLQICQHIEWLKSLQPVDSEKQRVEMESLKKTMYFIATGKYLPENWYETKRNKNNYVPTKKNKTQKRKKIISKNRVIIKKERKVREKKLLPKLGEGVSWVFVKESDGTLKSVPVIRHDSTEINNKTKKDYNVNDGLDSDEYEVDVLEDIYATDDVFDDLDQNDEVDENVNYEIEKNVMETDELRKGVGIDAKIVMDTTELQKNVMEAIGLQKNIIKTETIDFEKNVVETIDTKRNVIETTDLEKNKKIFLEVNGSEKCDLNISNDNGIVICKHIENLKKDAMIVPNEIVTEEDLENCYKGHSENCNEINISKDFTKIEMSEDSKDFIKILTSKSGDSDKNVSSETSDDEINTTEVSQSTDVITEGLNAKDSHSKISTEDTSECCNKTLSEDELNELLKSILNRVETLGAELINNDRMTAMNTLIKCENIFKRINNFNDLQSILETYDGASKRRASTELEMENKKKKQVQ